MTLWNEGKNNSFAQHPMQIQMLNEIAHQLEVFAQYVETKNKGSMAAIYKTDLAIIQDILAEKRKLFGDTAVEKMQAVASKDLVYQQIMQLKL